MLPLVTANRLSSLQSAQPVEAQPPQDAANSSRRGAALDRDPPAGMALPTQPSTSAHVAAGVWPGYEKGLEERSRKPPAFGAECLIHLAKVFGVVLNCRAAAALVSPLSTKATDPSPLDLSASNEHSCACPF